MFKEYLRLFRVKQWIKNCFIFFPIVFAQKLGDSAAFLDVVTTFIAFCILSSGVYIFNDIKDVNNDKFHPLKSARPLASGKINLKSAAIFMIFFCISGLLIAMMVRLSIADVALIYLLVNVAYNIKFKKVVILDVISIAIGFELRIWAGSLAAGVLPSIWLQFCVLLISLFLGFVKRRHELSSLKLKAPDHRFVLSEYSLALLDQLIIICATLTIVFYALYTIAPEVQSKLGPYITYSLVFVVFGLFRYLYLVYVKLLGGEPGEVILKDVPMQIDMMLWMMYIFLNIYVFRF